MSKYMELARNRTLEIIKEKGLDKNRKLVATMSGIASSDVYNFLNGKKGISIDNLGRIAEALDKDLWQLLQPESVAKATPSMKDLQSKAVPADILMALCLADEKQLETIWLAIRQALQGLGLGVVQSEPNEDLDKTVSD